MAHIRSRMAACRQAYEKWTNSPVRRPRQRDCLRIPRACISLRRYVVAAKGHEGGEIDFFGRGAAEKRGIGFTAAGARRVPPAKNRVELGDGALPHYDYLVITTGPKVAFDEIEGLAQRIHAVGVPCEQQRGCCRQGMGEVRCRSGTPSSWRARCRGHRAPAPPMRLPSPWTPTCAVLAFATAHR